MMNKKRSRRRRRRRFHPRMRSVSLYRAICKEAMNKGLSEPWASRVQRDLKE
jgi:hypothetical protein